MIFKDLYMFLNWTKNPSTGQRVAIIALILFKIILVAIFASDSPAEFIYAGF